MDIFPLKVWRDILDKLKNPRDIQAVFASFPSLIEEKRLRRRKAFWLFEEVILILATWKNLLGTEDLLNCRLVCRRWSSAVDKIFEEDLHPDHYRDPLKYRNICYWEDNDRFNSIWQLPSIAIYTQSFKTDEIVWFLAQMEDNSGDRNPFVSRSASFELKQRHPLRCYTGDRDLQVDEKNRVRSQEFGDQLIYLLSKFGKHLYHFKLKLNLYSHSELEFLEFLAELLDLLPNLKFLTVECELLRYVNAFGNADYNLAEGIRFPRLPYLEKLKLNVYKERKRRFDFLPCCYKSIIHHVLTSAYSQQVERKTIELTNQGSYPISSKLKEFKCRLCQVFPKRMYYYYDDSGISEISHYEPSKFLLGHAINVTSLKFEALSKYYDTIEDDIIVKVLIKLPHLRDLEIQNQVHNLGESGDISQIRGRVKSLKYLKIEDNVSLRYDFLLSFPSLKHLVIYRSYTPNVEKERAAAGVVGLMKIRRQIDNGFIYRSNVWSLLPELKRVSLVDLDRVRTFTRDVREIKKPKKEETQKETNIIEWNRRVNIDGNQYEEGVESILDDRISVSVKNRWELLDDE